MVRDSFCDPGSRTEPSYSIPCFALV